MALPTRYCPSCLTTLRSATIKSARPATTKLALRSIPFNVQSRSATQSANAQKYRSKKTAITTPSTKKAKKQRTSYRQPDLKKATQFPLLDAMRYIRAAEVGQPPTVSKYELHVRLRTPKNGAVVRNRLRLPHPVKTDLRICVICPKESSYAKAAMAAGARVVGEEEVFDAVKDGRIEFDRCLCHVDSLPKLSKSGIARILGPRGLMPSAKLGTVVKDTSNSVKDMVGASEYRERMGVVRMAVGQLGYSPEELQRNIRAFVEGVKKDIQGLSDRISKDVHEVVLSSTHGPGISLNGDFKGDGSVDSRDLSTS